MPGSDRPHGAQGLGEGAPDAARRFGRLDLSDAQLAALSRLLDEADAVPVPERPAWMDAACAGDAALHAALSRMLADDTGDDGLLQPPSLWASRHGPGDVVGPYRLIEALGAGGMGEVWLAERSDGLVKRPVALKLPHRWLINAQFLDRFAREREILATLSHPGIARLYDVGIAHDGQPFLALERVQGQPITAACDEARMGVRRRLELFLQVLDAVGHAHAHLVVHRDIKPSNILVTREGDVRLLDFGVAKVLRDEPALGETVQGAIAHTPLYASPEQVAGLPVTTASDVYSLGVLLYELLTGQLPYRLARTSRAAVEEAVETMEAERPSAACTDAHAVRCGSTRKALVAALRGDLDVIVLKALKKERAQRYATVESFAADLVRHLQGDVVLARPDSGWYRLGRLLRKRRLEAAALGGVVLSLAFGLGAALWQAGIAGQKAKAAEVQARIAGEQTRLAQEEAAAARAAEAFMQEVFSAGAVYQDDPLKARTATARELLDRGAQRIEAALADAPAVKLKLLKTLSGMYGEMDLLDDRLRLVQQRVRLARSAYTAPHAAIADALLDLHEAGDRAGSTSPGGGALTEAIAMLDALSDHASLLRGKAELQLGDHLIGSDPDRARVHTELAVRILRAHPPSAELVTAHYLGGLIARKTGRLADASVAYAEAVRTAALAGPGVGDILTTVYTGRASVLLDLGDVAGAERSCREALAIEERNRGAGASLNRLDGSTCLADVFVRSSRFEQAVALLERHLPASRRFAARDGVSWEVLASWFMHAEALVRAGRAREALDILRLPARYQRDPELHAIAEAWSLEIEAAACLQLGRYAQAQALLARATEQRRRSGRIGTPIYNYNVSVRTQLGLAMGRAEDAAAALAEFVVPQGSPPLSSESLEQAVLAAEVALARRRFDDALAGAARVQSDIARGTEPRYYATWQRRAARVQEKARQGAGGAARRGGVSA